MSEKHSRGGGGGGRGGGGGGEARERDEVASPKACQRLACEIQKCLAANDYQEDKCTKEIEAWRKCVEEHHSKQQHKA